MNDYVWILSNYRSGSKNISRFLSWLLKTDKRINESFTPYNEKRIKNYYPETLFNNKFRKWKYGTIETRRDMFFKFVIAKDKLPNRMKLMRSQFFLVCGLKDSDKQIIEKIKPGLKYIFLKREDLINTTTSFYIALKSKQWVSKNNKIHPEKSIDVIDDELIYYYKFFKKYSIDNNWENYLINTKYLYLTFDYLTSKPINALREISEYISVPISQKEIIKYYKDDQKKYIASNHFQKDMIKKKLKELVNDLH